MFCSKCGANNNDQAKFCAVCGQPLTAQAAQTVTPVGKNQFLLTKATQKTKILGFVAWGLTLVLLLTMVLSYTNIRKTSIEDIPLVSTAMEMASLGMDEDVEDVFAELKDELYDQISDMEDDLDDIRDDLSPEEEEWCERFVEIGYALAEDFSLENISDVFDHVEALAEVAEDSEVFGTDDLDDLFDIFDGIDTAILTAINTALFISMAWALIWGLIGGGLRIRGFVIAGLVFSLFYTGICCGALVTLLVLAIHIALIVIITMINREYRAYKASIRPVA